VDWLRAHWITTLTVLLGVFLASLAVLFGMDTSDPEITDAERTFGVVSMGLLAAAIFAGLWLIRSGRGNVWVGLGLVGFGSLGGIVWFWMIIPPIIALLVLVFGVALRGLVRELATDNA